MTVTDGGGSTTATATGTSTTSCAGGVATYGTSWADDIQKYHASKATLPWRPEQMQPVRLITRYEKSREEREYDLVLGKFRAAEKELATKDNEAAKRKVDLEKSRAGQLRNVQRFNLINHAPMYSGARDPEDPVVSEASASRPVRRTSSVDYNVVTNIPKSGAGGATEPHVHGSPPSSPASENRRRRIREFNILTNKYHDRHESRESDEHARAKQHAAVVFQKRNDFHPVRIAFFDAEKEATFTQTRAQEQHTHGKDRIAKLPPREQFAEGKIYNILTQNVINPSQISRYDGHTDRNKTNKQPTAFEMRKRVEGPQQVARDEALCLNRFSHERHAQAFVHGFDPITNQSFDGIHGKPRVATRTHEPLPAWHVLEQGVASTNKVSVQSGATHIAISTKEPLESLAAAAAVGSSGDRRANVLVVEHTLATAATSSLASPSTNRETVVSPIRTGGFAQ